MLTHGLAGLVPVLIPVTFAGCASLGDTPADKRQAVLEVAGAQPMTPDAGFNRELNWTG
jgi:hypothetical protein